jgi:ABC-type multidrug transport system fused ATPase/permease subunit
MKKRLEMMRIIGISNISIMFLLALSFMSLATEMIGIGMFIPIVQFIGLDGDLDALALQSDLWLYVIQFFEFIGVNISLLVFLVMAFLLFTVRQLIIFIRLFYQLRLTHFLIKTLRDRIFKSYLMANSIYHDKVPTGVLTNIISTEVPKSVVGTLMPVEFIVYIIMAIGYTIILLFLSWEMTVASLLVFIVTSLIPRAWIRITTQIGRDLVNANTRATTFLISRLRSVRLIQLSGNEKSEFNNFYNLSMLQNKTSVLVGAIQAKTQLIIEPIVITMSLVFLYIAVEIIHMEVTMIGLYMVIILRMMPIIKSLILQFQNMQRALGSIEATVNRLKDLKKSKIVDNGTLVFDGLKHSIALNNVSFNYDLSDTDNNVIKNVSLNIPANLTTAIVGCSGSGKSTLVDLIIGMKNPNNGKIIIDNHECKEYKISSLLSSVSFVSQVPQIFNGTITNHIGYGEKNANINSIINAAKLAGASEFIENLSDGYNTVVGEDGARLSGGQRQRLDLARALMKKASILILDEPTSSLDAKSEHLFSVALKRIIKQMDTTILIITHRLASIVNSDQIIVMHNGQVESVGTHKQLITEDGWYKEAWDLQRLI